MAVAGQVSVKYIAETAEYTSGTDKVKRANAEVDASARKVGSGSPFGKLNDSLRETNKLMPALSFLTGGGMMALASKAINSASDAMLKYNKNVEDGMTKTQALFASAYDIPITGSILKLGDAYTGQLSEEEQLAKDKANREKVLQLEKDIRAEAMKLMGVSNQKHAARFDIAALNPKFSDEYARQHTIATEAAKADLAMRKELGALIDAQSAKELAIQQEIIAANKQAVEGVKGGIESAGYKIRIGLLQQTLEGTRDLFNFDKKESSLRDQTRRRGRK